MKKIIFENSDWQQYFDYAYSLVAKSRTKFIQEKDCIRNSFNTQISDFNYVSIAYKEKQKTGVTVAIETSFDNFGAPVITFSNDVYLDENNNQIYGNHYEVVLWEKGCNVWQVVENSDDENEKTTSILCSEFTFPVQAGSKINMSVTVKPNGFKIVIDGKTMHADSPKFKDDFFVGITACEGINHFYSFEIK